MSPIESPYDPLARGESGQPSLAPQYRAMVAFDICGFGSSADPHVLRLMRTSMYQIIKEAAATVQMSWQDCQYEDRGDGMFLLAPPGYSVHSLVDPLAPLIRTGLAQINTMVPPPHRLRLRMAVHHGDYVRDEHGVISPALNLLFRLLNAPVLKARFEQGDLALIVSEDVYQRVVTWGMGLIDRRDFQPLLVDNKETCCVAWAMLPPQLAEAPPTLAPTSPVGDSDALARLECLAEAIYEMLRQEGHPKQ